MAEVVNVLNTLPAERDIYTSRELAAHVFGVPVGEVTLYKMQQVRAREDEVGPVWLLNGGKPVRWPTTGGKPERVYAIRNAELYPTVDEIVKHLQGVPYPPKSAFSDDLRSAGARKFAMYDERKGRAYSILFRKHGIRL